MIKWTKRILWVLVSLSILSGIFLYVLLTLSKPKLNGNIILSGLSGAVKVERDAQGLVTVSADKRIDLARALGYVHAQERFFQMDLLRRVASGELSEIFGDQALELDVSRRLHRFRARVGVVYQSLTTAQKNELIAYSEGVNSGIADLSVAPFPYAMLRSTPRPWRAEDSLLVPVAMFFDLQDGSNRRELALEQMQVSMPPELFSFITSSGTEWDAAMIGDAIPTNAIPPLRAIDLRHIDKKIFETKAKVMSIAAPRGSNNFAVDGDLSESGSALVANDMHLGLAVPNIWFRARLKFGQGENAVDVSGVTLPGLPAVVVGSNTKVAWAFTNSYGDWLDFVRIQYQDNNQTQYLHNGKTYEVKDIAEKILVKNNVPYEFIVRETVFGPITARDSNDQDLALRWTAHEPLGLNLNLQQLEFANDVNSAIAVAQSAGMPAQNFVVGDRSGQIAWTIGGKIPLRDSPDSTKILEGMNLLNSNLQWLDPSSYPKLVNPESSRLWTANARVVDGEALRIIGDGGYEFGARAKQIRDGLFAREKFAEKDLLEIQKDDRAIFLERWRGLLQSVVQSTLDPKLIPLRNLTAKPLQRASIDAVDYRLVRAFRLNVHERVMNALAAPTRARWPDFVLPNLPQAEGVVWACIETQQNHLLDPNFESWNALLLDAATRVVTELGEKRGGLAARTWGERNTAEIQHPLSRALPILSWFLDMPNDSLAGDANMPRVQAPDFGASQRMVVSPGFEKQGIMHMPGGQSSHPLSPFYRAGHDDWAQARASSFLPGPTKYTLNFAPKKLSD